MAPAIIEKVAHALHIGHKDEAVKKSEAAPASPPEVPAPHVVPEGTAPHPAVTAVKGPVFDHNKVTVIFVLGGPGAGELYAVW